MHLVFVVAAERHACVSAVSGIVVRKLVALSSACVALFVVAATEVVVVEEAVVVAAVVVVEFAGNLGKNFFLVGPE